MEKGKRDMEVRIPPEIRPLVGNFLRRRMDELPLLREYMRNGDLNSVAAIAHKLKGNGTAFGFRSISEVGKELETAAKEGDASTVQSLVDELELLVRDFHGRGF